MTAFSIYGDLMAIYSYIGEEEYIFAALQISLFIIGQCIFGLGGLCSTFKWWNESIAKGGDHVGKFGILRKQLSVAGIYFAGLPSVSLNIYAAMTTKVNRSELMFAVMVKLSMLVFNGTKSFRGLIKNTNKRAAELEGTPRNQPRTHTSVHSTSSSQIPSPKKDSAPKKFEVETLSLRMASFMLSDYYIRIIPMLMILSTIAPAFRTMTAFFLFGTIWVFECFATRKMMTSTLQIWVILIAGGIQVFSSPSLLEVIKENGPSVISSRYLLEHGIRCFVGLLLCCLSLVKSSTINWTLSGLFVAELINNGGVIYGIYQSHSSQDSQQQNVQSIELQRAPARTNQLCLTLY